MRQISYLPAALADLRSIAFYIAEDNPGRAISFVDDLRRVAARIAEHPASFPARDDLAPNLRTANHGRYIIFFRIGSEAVEIVRVLHGARNLTRIFGA